MYPRAYTKLHYSLREILNYNVLQEAETRSTSALSAIRSRLAGSQTEDSWAQWSPEEEEDVPEGKGRPTPPPMTANAHLQHTALPELEESIADPAVLKTKRTLLLIVREMVQTERDYVRALEYIIEVSQILGTRNIYIFVQVLGFCEFCMLTLAFILAELHT